MAASAASTASAAVRTLWVSVGSGSAAKAGQLRQAARPAARAGTPYRIMVSSRRIYWDPRIGALAQAQSNAQTEDRGQTTEDRGRQVERYGLHPSSVLRRLSSVPQVAKLNPVPVPAGVR